MIQKESKRKDKIKNKAIVAKAVLKDPLATQDELVKKTGLGKGTVNRNMKELDQTGLTSEIIDKICSNDRELMDLVSGLNVREVKKIVNDDSIELNDLKTLNDITEKSTRRYTLFKGTATDKDGGLKDSKSEVYKKLGEKIDTMSPDEINSSLQDLLNG